MLRRRRFLEWGEKHLKLSKKFLSARLNFQDIGVVALLLYGIFH